MHDLTKENIQFRCRTCLIKLARTDTQETYDNGVNISFQITSKNMNIKNWLDKLLGEELTYNEMDRIDNIKYPQLICLGCFNKLQNFHEFRCKVLECTKKLQQIFFNIEHHMENDENQDSLKDFRKASKYELLLKENLLETEFTKIVSNKTIAPNKDEEILISEDPFDNHLGKKLKAMRTGCHKRQTERKSIVEIEQLEIEDVNGFVSSDDEMLANKLIKQAKSKSHEINGIGNDMATIHFNIQSKTDTDLNGNGDIFNQISASILTQCQQKRRTKEEIDEFPKEQRDNQIVLKRPPRRLKGLKNAYKCQKCKRSYAHKITLNAHVRKVHEGLKQPFKCDRCDKAYTFAGGLYMHIKEIHDRDGRRFHCDQPHCDRIYTSLITMQRHKRVKHSSTPSKVTYVCEQCGTTFTQSQNLKYHMKTKHPTPEQLEAQIKLKEQFECDICHKLFHSRYTLKYHQLQIHSNDMQYECDICGRRMAKKFMLIQHMLVHSDDAEKMPCEICGKKFIRKFELDSHVKAVHLKLKPFECQYCSECFASRKTLRHHEYIHTGEKPYVCDICNQTYRQRTCLKIHRRTHQKPNNDTVLSSLRSK